MSMAESDRASVEDMPNTGSGDERVCKRPRIASPTASFEDDDPYSLFPGRAVQSGKKAKVAQDSPRDLQEGLAGEPMVTTSSGPGFSPQGLGSRTAVSEQGLSPCASVGPIPTMKEKCIADESIEPSGQQCVQREHDRGSLAPCTSTRQDGKETGACFIDVENAVQQKCQEGGMEVGFREGEKFTHNRGGGKPAKETGERANGCRGAEEQDSVMEGTKWASVRGDDDNPVLASLIGLASNHRNKTSRAFLEGSKENEVRNTQAVLDSEEDDRQFRALLKEKVAEMTAKVEEMEHQVAEVLRMRSAVIKNKTENGKPGTNMKESEKDRLASNNKKHRQFEASRRESAQSKRMADLMRQFSTILRQITQHKWAWPFMSPVDVVALGLHDYFDVIKKPMDLGTIREKINNPKEGAGYKNVQEMCDDVRLVFSNAMTYNQEGTDVHIMAKTLSEKFEEKWRTVLEPKLLEEEAKKVHEQREFEVKEVAEFEAAEEAATENLAHVVCKQLVDLEDQLEDLKLQATSRCRTMSIEEKRQLGYNLGRLPPGPLNRVIQIIAKKNPDFNAAAYEVEVDIDAQDPATLWQLHCYVQMVLNPKSNEASAQMPSISKKKPHHLMPEKVSKKQDENP